MYVVKEKVQAPISNVKKVSESHPQMSVRWRNEKRDRHLSSSFEMVWPHQVFVFISVERRTSHLVTNLGWICLLVGKMTHSFFLIN